MTQTTRIAQSFTQEADTVLDRAVAADAPVAGVVAMVTDRDSTVYEGAAGVRRLGGDDAMTTDTVFALFSTTKAVTEPAAGSRSSRAGVSSRGVVVTTGVTGPRGVTVAAVTSPG